MAALAFAAAGVPLRGVRATQGSRVVAAGGRRGVAAAAPRVRCCTAPAASDAAVSISGVSDAPSTDGPPSISSLADVQDIVRLAREFDLADLRIADAGVTIEISMPGGRGFKDGKLRDIPEPPAPTFAAAPGQPVMPMYEQYEEEDPVEEYDADNEMDSLSAAAAVEAAAPSVEEADEDGVFKTDFVVTSNRVGFFFSGAKGKPPLVNVDDHVAFNQPVCIIEQLGQQYVYLSEVSGTVVKIFVEDGDPIQYGSKVMVIRPD